MKVIICQDKQEVSREAAAIFIQAINSNPEIVLGLATGGTPVGMYKELIEMNKKGKVNFSKVKSFNLDEYAGLDGSHPQSYRFFMNQNLFNHINIDKSNTYVPEGKFCDCEQSCRNYEEAIKKNSGIDLQLLGIGSNGHIAFNEPGSPEKSRTRKVDLTARTIDDNTRFFDNRNQVPTQAITMGIETILEAKQIILLATGANKATAVTGALKGPVGSRLPASFLQGHSACTFIVDKAAACEL
ncbi:MAG: glucosamine-6-phosphate deaminase [Candidatus Omnitrophica bacterium]|nr:glucosamine-6-phosphate deaminase [Candidatus Omnitrophota bacterium]MDD5430083.1 glucosamine-6-phosphate deaminase [Candidatus Omnitrophota bacterium]